MEMNLYGLAMSQYKTVTNFAQHIGWGRQKASRIINGQQRPTADDMEELKDVLHIDDINTFMRLFFPSLSTK